MFCELLFFLKKKCNSAREYTWLNEAASHASHIAVLGGTPYAAQVAIHLRDMHPNLRVSLICADDAVLANKV